MVERAGRTSIITLSWAEGLSRPKIAIEANTIAIVIPCGINVGPVGGGAYAGKVVMAVYME